MIAGQTVVLPGDRAQLAVTVSPEGLATVGVEVRRRLLIGSTAWPGADTDAMLRAFPATRYMRDFGRDADKDARPELPPHGQGKMATPASCILHVSWKDDVEQLATWLNGLQRPIYLTWWHEPHGDMTPAEYRAQASRMAQIIAQHPRRHLVLGHGPIITRYWMVEKAGNPADWWYPEATFFGNDAYNNSSTKYRSAQEMFGKGAEFARSKGVPWLVPEYGIERITSDTTGAGRVKAMRDHMAWIRQQPDCLAVGWWDIGGDRITGLEPEQTTWRHILAGGQ